MFFWAAIITIRTGATNIGDIFHHYGIGFAISVPVTFAAFIALVLLYRREWLSSATRSVGVTPIYWSTMILAGVLGTVGGDAASFGLHLMPPGTAAVFGGLALIAILLWSRSGQIARPIQYWTVLALIRTCGTGAGDALSHQFGFGLSTALTGTIFLIVILFFYLFEQDNEIRSEPKPVN